MPPAPEWRAPDRHVHDPARLDLGNYPFTREIVARFSDVDSQRHLNNVAISAYYEDSRATLARHLFGENYYAGPRDFRFVVLRNTLHYLAEAPYPATYEVGAGITRVGGSSFEESLGLFLDGRCVGLCETVMVHLTDAGPAPLPAERRALPAKVAFPARKSA
jgi:acyl-CoA thioester hydrolase